MPSLRRNLEDLVRIDVGAWRPDATAEVWRVRPVADLFRVEGFAERRHRQRDPRAAVLGLKPGPEVGDRPALRAPRRPAERRHADWTAPPFEPTERGGRLYGRGAADDKAGVAAHLGALRVFGDDLPVGQGRRGGRGGDRLRTRSPRCSSEHRDKLEADVIVIADSANWDIGSRATTSLRGLVRLYVEVRRLDHGVTAACGAASCPTANDAARLLATLHDDAGNVADDGLVGELAADVEYPSPRRGESGVSPGRRLDGRRLDGRASQQAVAQRDRHRRPCRAGR